VTVWLSDQLDTRLLIFVAMPGGQVQGFTGHHNATRADVQSSTTAAGVWCREWCRGDQNESDLGG